MSHDDFWNMTPRELFNAISGYHEKSYNTDLQAWKRSRWETWLLLKIQLKAGAHFPITDLLPLDDEIEKAPEPSPEDLKRIAEIERKWDAQMKRKNQIKTNINAVNS